MDSGAPAAAHATGSHTHAHHTPNVPWIHTGPSCLAPGSGLISFHDALARVIEAALPRDVVERPLMDARGSVLAESLVALEPAPPFDQSAMDGYALRAEDTTGATPDGPVALPIAGEVAAGAAAVPPLTPGTAVRIMTGARVPPGADAVLPVEQTRESDGGRVALHAPADVGDFIRRTGEDMRPGTVLLAAGTHLGPAQVGLLASQGRATARVFRPPTVALLSTGDELLGGSGGRIRDVNGPMLAALAGELGCPVADLGVAADDPEAIYAALRAGLAEADVVVTSGGVSAGRYDRVPEAVERCGAEWLFRKVLVKPGLPTAAARRGAKLLFGLPGNPVSALVTFLQFVRPALRRMGGAAPNEGVVVVPAVLEHAIRKGDGKRHFHRVIVARGADGYVARSSGGQGSHMVASLARANGLVQVPEDSAGLEAGQVVDVELLAPPA